MVGRVGRVGMEMGGLEKLRGFVGREMGALSSRSAGVGSAFGSAKAKPVEKTARAVIK